ncbi:MAG: glycosyltransferase [Crocinitomicaceae bacterium]|nr:glycosyltransferase [Flavobacteriales bacterium]NQZ36074.1 glycosyltransferase [Crocinitomicaceae bacterium]
MKGKKTKILVILDNGFDPDIRVNNEIKILQHAGYEITLLCFAFNSKVYSQNEAYTIIRVPIKKSYKNRLFFFASWLPFYTNLWSKHIINELNNGDFDLIYAHDLYMIAPVHKSLEKLKSKTKFVIDLHEHFPAAIESYSWTNGFLRKMLSQPRIWYTREKKDLQHPDLCITLSDTFSNRLSEIAKRSIDDYYAFPNITPLEPLVEFNTQLDYKQSDVVFLYYGAIGDRRGIFDLFEAFLEVIEKCHNAKLLLIGPVDKSDKSKFENYLNNPKIASNVKYIPWIESKYWQNFAEESHFCLAPFLVNPQHNSGVANKIYQYLQAGKFTIASNCTPQQILLESYDGGIIFKNQKEFAQALEKCYFNKETYILKGKNAKIKFKQQDDYQKNMNSYLDRIQQLLLK